MKYRFGGEQVTTYDQYLDVEKQATLVAEPGEVYNIIPARGAGDLPVPPDGRWGPVRPAKSSKED